MNLASRLDRLRGQVAGPAPQGATMDERLTRQRVGSPHRSNDTRDIAALVLALDAQSEIDGLLMRRRVYSLPAVFADRANLNALPEVCDLHSPDWVYIDTETTGLSGGVGNLAFMVGVARYSGPCVLEVRQFVLASFAAEARLLRTLFDWIGPDPVLVSYNGKCFDVPLLRARLGMQRMDADPAGMRHLDLMYAVRRAYRGYWPDCRLQTAERRLLGLRRIADMPGSQAPAAWQAWLRSGITRPLSGVLEHNYQDVVSLALLHQRLLSDYAGNERAGCNHAAIGGAWYEAGREEAARRVWEAAGRQLDDCGCLALAGLYRRRGDWARAEALWLDLEGRGSIQAALELAKYYEHRARDYRRAMDFAHRCEGVGRDERLARLRRRMADSPQLSFWEASSGCRQVASMHRKGAPHAAPSRPRPESEPGARR